MLAVKLICCGKLKERFYKEASAEYEKRLSGFCKLTVARVDEEGLEKEAENILGAIPQGAYVVAMCIEGKQMSSEDLAKRLAELQNRGVSHVCIVIGSSEGLSERVKAKADTKLNMSPMTFPHHLAQVMVLEQLYRAFSINAGSRYHK